MLKDYLCTKLITYNFFSFFLYNKISKVRYSIQNNKHKYLIFTIHILYVKSEKSYTKIDNYNLKI